MNAKYPGTCQYCKGAIVPGDEITRGNGDRRHAGYGHARCVPTAGVHNRAGWSVEVVEGDAKGYIAAGHKRQFVREAKAESVAQHLRDLGCAKVEVRAFVDQGCGSSVLLEHEELKSLESEAA